MRFLIALLTLTLSLHPAVAVSAEKSKSKKKSQPSETNNLEIKKVIEPEWQPSSFKLDSDRLPANFEGLDYKKFMTMFDSKLKIMNKGEFETSEEHTKRIENIDSILRPISTNEKYAFNLPIRIASLKYDADKQKYFSDTRFGYSCKPADPKYVTCFVDSLADNSETYIGSNRYGAQKVITKSSGVDFALAINPENGLYKSLFTTHSYYDKGMIMTLELEVSLDKAKNIKDKEIAAIFVGNLTEAKKINGARVYYSATFDSPSAMDFQTVAIPFNLESIIFYVKETGEILAQYPKAG